MISSDAKLTHAHENFHDGTGHVDPHAAQGSSPISTLTGRYRLLSRHIYALGTSISLATLILYLVHHLHLLTQHSLPYVP